MFKKIKFYISKSISVKVAILLFICIVLVMSVIGIISFIYEKDQLISKLVKESQYIADRLSTTLTYPLWNIQNNNMEQKEIIDKMIEQEMIWTHILAIIVYDYRGNLYSAKIKIPGLNPINFNNYNEYKKVLIKSKIIDVIPILKDTYKIGTLEIYITDYYVKLELAKLVIRVVFQTIAISLFILLILFISLRQIIINPLLYIDRIVNQFSMKNFNYRIPKLSEDEIGDLAEKFNTMADMIEQFTDSLETLVEMRTEELSKALKKIQETEEALQKELVMAQRIQESLIPKNFPVHDKFNFYGLYLPLETLGGDYYDVFKINESKLGFVIADVSGHGIPSALITTMAKISFSVNMKNNIKPCEIISEVNKEVCNAIGENPKYLTAFCGIIDANNLELFYTNAAHTPVFIIRNNGEIETLEANSIVLGTFPDAEYNCDRFQLNKNDKIILYTDGIIETWDDNDNIFGEEKLKEILKLNYNKPLKEISDKIIEEITAFRGKGAIKDDIALLIIEIL